ncbi:SMI1/KNR4 family protein [Streptomyces sp. NPDC002845]
MTDTIFDWRSFLRRWSEECAEACDADGVPRPADEESRRARRLGFAPASPDRIAALEERLGRRLPPSYRTFLEVTDGWRHAGGFVYLLAGTEGARWHEDAAGMSQWYQDELDEDSTEEEISLAGMWNRALQPDVESDAMYVLMDPEDVDDAGEWAVHVYASLAAEYIPKRTRPSGSSWTRCIASSTACARAGRRSPGRGRGRRRSSSTPRRARWTRSSTSRVATRWPGGTSGHQYRAVPGGR